MSGEIREKIIEEFARSEEEGSLSSSLGHLMFERDGVVAND